MVLWIVILKIMALLDNMISQHRTAQTFNCYVLKRIVCVHEQLNGLDSQTVKIAKQTL